MNFTPADRYLPVATFPGMMYEDERKEHDLIYVVLSNVNYSEQ